MGKTKSKTKKRMSLEFPRDAPLPALENKENSVIGGLKERYAQMVESLSPKKALVASNASPTPAASATPKPAVEETPLSRVTTSADAARPVDGAEHEAVGGTEPTSTAARRAPERCGCFTFARPSRFTPVEV